MVDQMEGIQKQDLSIFYMIEKNSKGVVVLVNKWDLLDKDQNTAKKYEDKLRAVLAPLMMCQLFYFDFDETAYS